MAALDFPSSPTVGQVYTANGKSWQWDGVSWISYNTLIAAGSNTQIQFNNSGAFGASSNLTWNGSTLATTGFSASGTVTLSGGTANGVAYLNGSKVLTTGSGLTFDGTYLTVGSATSVGGSAGSLTASGPVAAAGYLTAHKTGVAVLEYSSNKCALRAYGATAGTGYWAFNVGGGGGSTDAEAMRIDSYGNLGLGVTPISDARSPTLQVGGGGTFRSESYSSTNNQIKMLCNAYEEVGTGYKYINTSSATMYLQINGQHLWNIAASGTGGTAISFTQAMTLTAAGDLGVYGSITANANLSGQGISIFRNGADGGGIVAGLNNASLSFQTSSTERARITAAGNLLVGKTSATANGGDVQVSRGVTFPATQIASSDVNTLDDYEEGSWSPTISGFTFVGADTSTYYYVKIGKLVTVNIYIIAATSVTIANGASVSLPFTQERVASGVCISPNTGNSSIVTAYSSNAVFKGAAAASASFTLSFSYIATA